MLADPVSVPHLIDIHKLIPRNCESSEMFFSSLHGPQPGDLPGACGPYLKKIGDTCEQQVCFDSPRQLRPVECLLVTSTSRPLVWLSHPSME